MKSLTLFMHEVLEDLGTWCCTSTIQDYNTVLERIEHEGWSFMTITLPKFCDDFQKSLEQGFTGHDQYLAFARSGGLPRFLGGFLDQVFDRASGRLLDRPSITAIWAIRQFTLMWAKINWECSEERTSAAIRRYVECEQDVRRSDATLDEDRKVRFRRMATLIWSDVFQKVDEDIYYGRLKPRHGPGATADSLTGNRKWDQREWTERLETVFPHWEYLTSSLGPDAMSSLADVHVLEPGAERPVRVITVPKTQKTPRIIAIEPTCMQYMQQAIEGSFVEAMKGEEDKLTYGLIGYDRQEPNQLLARKGSSDGSLATLDMSEASDRVSNQHVLMLLRNHPNLTAGVQASRSRKADVPGHGVIRLAKFASMGSALCFPMESAVFMTVIFMGIERELNRQLTRKDIFTFLGRVRVYGDDIVVPVDFVRAVIEELEAFGLRVNSGKSFWNGKFRESCGRDYYDGEDVSVVRVRSSLPSSRRHAPEIISTVSLRNRLYEAGLWRAVAYLDRVLEGIIPFPYVARSEGVHVSQLSLGSRILGRFSFLGIEPPTKFDRHTHTPLVRGMIVTSRTPASRLENYGALMKCLVKRGDLPFADARHLERAGRPLTVDIKQRWGPSC